MKISNCKLTHKAQALLEVTMLASILLFLLSVIVRTGVMSNERQKFFMESFRDAVERASNTTIQHNTLDFTGEYFENVRVPDAASHSGVQNIQQLKASWSVRRTDRLSFAAGTNYESMRRKSFIIGGQDGLKSVDNKAETNSLLDGFTTEGFKEGFKLPRYDIPVPYLFYQDDPTEEMYCIRYKMPDPEDVYPSDGIFWSWVALCGRNWEVGKSTLSLDSGIPFFHANCERCDEDKDEDRIYSSYVADTETNKHGRPGQKAPCHPASSADTLKGTKFYAEDELRFEYYLYFQSAYDPSVPLEKEFMAYMHCYDPQKSEPGNYQFSTCSWTPDQIDTGQWILFAYDTFDHGQFQYLLIDGLKAGPFISRGKRIWLSFDDLTNMLPDTETDSSLDPDMLADENFRKAVAYTSTVQYANCDAIVEGSGKNAKVASTWFEDYGYGCGGEFTISSLVSSTCKDANWKLKTAEDDATQFWFGAIDGLDLKHTVWGDIDIRAAASRVPDQGIKGYRLRSVVDIKVETTGKGGTIKTETRAKVKDIITRKLVTNPFGRLFGGTEQNRTHGEYDITQERDVNGTFYEYKADSYE